MDWAPPGWMQSWLSEGPPERGGASPGPGALEEDSPEGFGNPFAARRRLSQLGSLSEEYAPVFSPLALLLVVPAS